MNVDTEITVNLIRDIINGQVNLEQTKSRICEIENQYGTDFFLDYEIEKKINRGIKVIFRNLKLKVYQGWLQSNLSFILRK